MSRGANPVNCPAARGLICDAGAAHPAGARRGARPAVPPDRDRIAMSGPRRPRFTRKQEDVMSSDPARPKLSEKGLLTPDNCVVAIIDLQPQMLFGVANFDRQAIINN